MNFECSKEREKNNFTFLTGYFALILHFIPIVIGTKNINIYAGSKAQTENKLSQSKKQIYLFRVPNAFLIKILFLLYKKTKNNLY